MSSRITDAELHAAAAALYELHGHSPSKVCEDCGRTPARLEATDGTLHCRRCFQSRLNHARLHVPEAFDRE